MKTKTILLSMLLFAAFGFFAKAQPGAIDLTFNPTDIGFGFGDGANGFIYTTAIQPDGKIIIGGSFTAYNGTSRNRIARINADGTLDGSFNPGTGADGYVHTISIQSDGKIIIGGAFDSVNGEERKKVVRLNADGSLDVTFIIGYGATSTVYTTAIQSDGKIIIGGNFNWYDNTTAHNIARINTDGTLDATFNPTMGANGCIYTTAIQSDGKIIIGGDFSTFNGVAMSRIARLYPNGSLDGAFNVFEGADSTVYTTAIQSDGKIIIGGAFTSYNGTARNYIARLTTNGYHDATFNMGTGADNIVRTAAVQSGDKIIIGGDFSTYNGTARNRIARLYADGTLDGTFNIGTGADNTVNTTATLSNGKIIIGGKFISYNGTFAGRVTSLNSNGTLDANFIVGTGVNRTILTSAIQSDGKIIIGGKFTACNGTSRYRIARLNTDGTPDAAFNPGTGTNDHIYTAAIQNDGKIIIGGGFSAYNGTTTLRLARLNTNGSLDTTFNSGVQGMIFTTAIQVDGKIIIGGTFNSYNGTPRNNIARLNTDGTLDATFNPGTGPNLYVYTTAIQNDGKIIIGGDFFNYNGTAINRIARLNADGTLDGTFDPGTGADFNIQTTAIQSDGKIIIGGKFGTFGTATYRFARLNTDGTLDASFNTGTGADSNVYTISIQNDGKIIIGGDFTSYNGTIANHIARLNADGTIDGTFNMGTGADITVYTTAKQPDGKIIIGGDFLSYNGTGRNRIARIFANPVGINENNNKNSLLIFPNPTKGKVSLNFTGYSGDIYISINNNLGSLVFTENILPDSDNFIKTIDLSKYPMGIYYIQIVNNGKTTINKIVKL